MKQQHPTQRPYYQHEDQSIWQSVKQIFTGAANAVTHTTNAVGTLAKAGDVLAHTALVMAESNDKLVSLEVSGKEAQKLLELQDMYGQHIDIGAIIDGEAVEIDDNRDNTKAPSVDQ